MTYIHTDAAATASLGWLAGIATIIFMVSFTWWIVTIFSNSARPRLDAAARLPLEDGR